MAAELEHLIACYRAAGLQQAASWLLVAKRGLEAEGLLPAQLPALPARRARPTTGQPVRRFGLDAAGRVFLRHDGEGEDERDLQLARARPHELDRLRLSPGARNALVLAGVSTIAEVQLLVETNSLRRFHHLGQTRAKEITQKIDEFRSRETLSEVNECAEEAGLLTSDLPPQSAT